MHTRLRKWSVISLVLLCGVTVMMIMYRHYKIREKKLYTYASAQPPET